jgi:hypothetical protein
LLAMDVSLRRWTKRGIFQGGKPSLALPVESCREGSPP